MMSSGQSSGESSPTACVHVWGAWSTEARPLYSNAPGDVIYILVRKCFVCGQTDFGSGEIA